MGEASTGIAGILFWSVIGLAGFAVWSIPIVIAIARTSPNLSWVIFWDFLAFFTCGICWFVAMAYACQGKHRGGDVTVINQTHTTASTTSSTPALSTPPNLPGPMNPAPPAPHGFTPRPVPPASPPTPYAQQPYVQQPPEQHRPDRPDLPDRPDRPDADSRGPA